MGLRIQNQWCQRMRGIGLPRELGYRILDLVARWHGSSGPEWTVNRLKALKQDLVRFHAGLPPVGVWYAKTPSGRPKGPIGELWKQPLAKAVATLNVYTTIVAQEATPTQWAKFYNSVRAEPLKGLTLESFKAGLKTMPRKETRPYVHEGFHTLPVDPSRRAPVDLWTGKTGPETDWYQCLWDVALSPAYAKAYATFKCVKETVDNSPHQIDFEDLLPLDRIGRLRCFHDEIVGKIGFTQEPGCKLRAFASPVRLHQAILEPLKRDLFGYLRRIPQDCTFDQRAGVIRTMDALRQGLKCFSIDLSDATNNFSLDLIVKTLKHLGFPEDDLAYMYAVSRGQWRVDPRCLSKDIKEKPETIQWTKGIPLGLGPAFAAFAITNHLLVRNCEALFKQRDTYSILGDDIVIYHPDVAAAYRDTLEKLGCPVSEGKTIASDKLAEFAGQLITAERSIPSPKWRAMSDDNFLEIVKLLGPQATSLLRPRQKRVFKRVAPLPEPWGLGWNPRGLSLDARWHLVEALNVDSETMLWFRNSNDAYRREFNRLALDEAIPEVKRDHFRWTFRPEKVTEPSAGSEVLPTRQDHRLLPTAKEQILAATGVFEELCSEDTSFIGFTPFAKPSRFRPSTLQVLERKLTTANLLDKPESDEVAR